MIGSSCGINIWHAAQSNITACQSKDSLGCCSIKFLYISRASGGATQQPTSSRNILYLGIGYGIRVNSPNGARARNSNVALVTIGYRATTYTGINISFNALL